MLIKRLQRNTSGRDILVGDIHGCFSKLEASLASIHFDPDRDRLISVGDMVDRGSESHLVAKWLAEPWFFAVSGNHEAMTLDAANGGEQAQLMHLWNGGMWFRGLMAIEKVAIVDALGALPLAIEIETEYGLVGVVHADCPAERWQDFTRALEHTDDLDGLKMACQWSRDRFDNQERHTVDGVRAVVVGHTPVHIWHTLGNVIFIDSGAWLPEHHGKRDFTLLDAATLKPLAPPSPAPLDWS